MSKRLRSISCSPPSFRIARLIKWVNYLSSEIYAYTQSKKKRNICIYMPWLYMCQGAKAFLAFPFLGLLEMKINHIDSISFHQTHKLTNSKIKICKAMRYLFCFFCFFGLAFYKVGLIFLKIVRTNQPALQIDYNPN